MSVAVAVGAGCRCIPASHQGCKKARPACVTESSCQASAGGRCVSLYVLPPPSLAVATAALLCTAEFKKNESRGNIRLHGAVGLLGTVVTVGVVPSSPQRRPVIPTVPNTRRCTSVLLPVTVVSQQFDCVPCCVEPHPCDVQRRWSAARRPWWTEALPPPCTTRAPSWWRPPSTCPVLPTVLLEEVVFTV